MMIRNQIMNCCASVAALLLVLLVGASTISSIDAFLSTPPPCHWHHTATTNIIMKKKKKNRQITTTTIFGAFNKRNKQGDLIKKMQEAKRQRELNEMGQDGDTATAATTTTGNDPSSSSVVQQSGEEIKKMNDMKRFEELLNRESATLSYDFDKSANYLTKQQEEDMLDATFDRKKDRLFEGDPAPIEPFEDLISIMTENALAKKGAKRIVPWINTKISKQKDYLVVISDPRENSSELRNTMKLLTKGLNAEILSKTIIINADTPAVNRRWLKKQELTDSIKIYTDEKREWMREYSALGDNRWRMTMFILADGRVQKLIRELDEVLAVKAISNAVKSFEKQD